MNPPSEPAASGLPPLSLYVHLPWCVRKCPYCDFNSHAAGDVVPADRYIDALFRDLETDLPLVWGRVVQSVFFGGGTPSLFTAGQVERMIAGFRSLLPIAPGAEITLEANPGTVERDSFSAYREAGVNRFSLGVQTFDDACLQRIGRIHDRDEVARALESVARSGIDNFNIDLMFGLPGQSVEMALDDVREALAARPAHLSRYQLTLEPNTAFHANPPAQPDDDTVAEMQESGGELLVAEDFVNYEVSAWAQPGRECRHNLNYWTFGDYLGIGAGAHGKITVPAAGEVRRRIRKRHPRDWMAAAESGNAIADDRAIGPSDLVFEFFLNHLRLSDGIPKQRLQERTGQPWSSVEARVREAVENGLLEDHGERIAPTETGRRFLNDLQALFLP